jgi:septal ring factor EnvC (AmiA/AmiB activator)
MPDDDRTTSPGRRRPTAWIVMTAVLAAVAVGLGIWAFSAQSDADDAQAKLDAQPQAASAGAATPEPVQVDSETQQRYDELKTEIGVTGDNLDQLDEQLGEAAANAEKAEQARTDAADAIDRASAEVDAFKARAAVAQGCLRGALDAFDAAFSAGGLEAAVAELETLSSGCRSAASP